MKKSSAAVPSRQPISLGRVLKASALLALVATVALTARMPLIWQTEDHNGELLTARYRLAEDPFNHPKLVRLRQREHLDQVTAAGKTQFEKAVLLRHWVRSQWETKTPFSYPPWDALEILDLARSGKSRGFCAQYAIVFLQACQAMGIHARYVELAGHFVTAIWSDDYDRWVVMDPTNDLYYERDGLPLHGRELHVASLRGPAGIVKVKADGSRLPATTDDLAPYRKYAIVQLANQLSQPALVQVNGARRRLTHEEDYRAYPMVGRDNLGIVSSFLAWNSDDGQTFADKPQSNDTDDFRYHMNQTLVFIARRRAEEGLAKVLLSAENAPTCERFLVRVNEQDWQPVAGSEVLWKLQPGLNRMSARMQTQGGWLGPISEVALFYKPSWPARKADLD